MSNYLYTREDVINWMEESNARFETIRAESGEITPDNFIYHKCTMAIIVQEYVVRMLETERRKAEK